MNDTHFAIVGAWVAAAIAELLHRRGEKKNSVYSRRASEITMLAAIITLSIIAWNHPLPEIRFTSAAAAQPTVNSAPSTINPQPSTMPFFASTLERKKDGKPYRVYHRVGCQYDRLTEHREPFPTKESAEAAGCVPCSRCSGLAAGLPAQVESQQSEDVSDLEGDDRGAEQLVQGNH